MFARKILRKIRDRGEVKTYYLLIMVVKCSFVVHKYPNLKSLNLRHLYDGRGGGVRQAEMIWCKPLFFEEEKKRRRKKRKNWFKGYERF